MFRYVLSILLINTFYHSSGNPILIPSKQISVSLLALESSCENLVLKSLLNTKIKECSETIPPYKTKQLQCLMFYDMSVQLCSAVSASKLTFGEDYTTKLNEEKDVNSLCETAKNWVFTELQEYHNYKQIIEKIFKQPVSCGKICGSDELISDDTNFYCKYYNWGLQELATHLNTVSQNSSNLAQVGEIVQDTSNANSLLEAQNGKESQDISVKSTTSDNKPKEIESLSNPSEQVSSSDINTKPVVPETTTNNQTTQIPTKIKETDKANVPVVKPEELPVVVSANEISKIENEEKIVETKNATITGLDKTLKVENVEERKEFVLENPKDKAVIESDHYQDDNFNSEEGKEVNDDEGDDDGGDPMLGENVKPPQKKTEVIDKIEPIDTSFNKEIIPREFYSGNVQDVSSVDDNDDHFFTFFLTAIVLVVLLYVLYHDKSKISKLFFGLLVEGRQNGRRRNSRGHTYRRLDTLEQAMSTNTAAPPSKIIY